MGCATVASTTAELAPGYVVETWTCGGTMSGYCASGMINNDKRPAIVVTRAMTIASRGRSTNIADSMALAAIQRRGDRLGLDRRSRSQALDALDDDEFATLETFGDDNVLAARATCLDPADGGFPVFGDENINSLLIADQRGLRNDDLLLRVGCF